MLKKGRRWLKIKMWPFLGIFLAFFEVVRCSGTEIFPVVPDMMRILQSEHRLNVSETCEAHLKDYLAGILRRKPWALQMLDSITKFPDGVLLGHFTHLGHFDECVNAASEKFSGKYCLASLSLKNNKLHSPYFDNESLLLDFHGSFIPNIPYQYAVCMPSTCSGADIQNAIRSAGEFNFDRVNVTDKDCSTSDFRPFRIEDWVTVGVVVFIAFVTLSSTAYDLLERFKRKNETPNKLWTSFSLYTNGKFLFGISQSSSQMKCLHGIRLLSMSWVILCHTYLSYAMGANINMLEMIKFMKSKSFIPISNAFVSVDSFFFLSGLLVCLVFFRDISKKKTYDVPVAFLHRYIRLTPPLAFLILIQATIMSRIGNGPLWSSMDLREETCRKNWWAGLLYLQNYLRPKAMCIEHTWYLSADMQMFWVSPLILYPLLWFPSFAPAILLVLVLAAAFTNFAVAFVNNLEANLYVNLNVDFNENRQFRVEYITFHTRMAPYLIGIATGYIICGVQAKKIRLKLSKVMVVVGWVVALSLLGGSLFGISRFMGYSFGQVKYTKTESAFYLAFHRVGWALGMSWVVVACVCGYGGPVNDFLSLDFFQPLAKLSYCNYLIHMILQNYRMFTSRMSGYIRHFDIVYSFAGDLVISNLISIPVVLLFEVPFMNLDRYFLNKLVIFPFPKPRNEDEERISKEKPEESAKALEEGKGNNESNKS